MKSVATAIQVTAEINQDDLTLLCVMTRYAADNSRSPQRWEVLSAARRESQQPARIYERRFDRLKILGVIEHSRNGHCWLSEAGVAALATLNQGASHV